MPAPTQNLNHVSEGLARLTDMYRRPAPVQILITEGGDEIVTESGEPIEI
jgi:hypothetical protein